MTRYYIRWTERVNGADVPHALTLEDREEAQAVRNAVEDNPNMTLLEYTQKG